MVDLDPASISEVAIGTNSQGLLCSIQQHNLDGFPSARIADPQSIALLVIVCATAADRGRVHAGPILAFLIPIDAKSPQI